MEPLQRQLPGPGNFCPNEPVQRWVMAVWLVRALGGGQPAAIDHSRFLDVNPDHW